MRPTTIPAVLIEFRGQTHSNAPTRVPSGTRWSPGRALSRYRSLGTEEQEVSETTVRWPLL